ncbi:hypothetical protein KR093_007245 [Drosophila rubida]|uniref:Uncharacterized protein n=1 Tax=Drosophila rubida TaxID=30044 RepID=A0AAD4K654_9MUSC|nr:hypothetical protein KR093_007245 [Drosophila rubida]
MSHTIEPTKVVEYIRDTMEPVSYEVLVSKFCDSKATEEVKMAMSKKLQDVLVSQVETGSITHYNDHFYASQMTDKLQDAMDEGEDGEMSSDSSQISFSSYESTASKSSTASSKDVKQSDTESSEVSQKSKKSKESIQFVELKEEPKPQKSKLKRKK